jgi:metal-responsive CopG/Arc/MetJ family transcriptional regulator
VGFTRTEEDPLAERATTRTHVILSTELLTMIDDLVGERGRSRFLEEAAREKLDRRALEDFLEHATGVISAKDHPEWADDASTSAWVRRIRGRDDPV